MSTQPNSDLPQTNWNFYSCHIDGKPHSAMIDMEFSEVAPIKSHGVFHVIEVGLRFPHPEHGMTTAEEAETLFTLEDFVTDHQHPELHYVGRHTGNAKRSFFFYGKGPTSAAPLLSALKSTFPDYEFATFHFEDPTWSTYFDDLYPNEMALNEIGNRHVCSRLADHGDDLNAPRPVDHFVKFQTKEQAKAFMKALDGQGFDAQINTDEMPDHSCEVALQRIDAPAMLDPITWQLQQTAKTFGGDYDGWGCGAVIAAS